MFKRLFASRKNPYIPGLDNPEHISLNIGADGWARIAI